MTTFEVPQVKPNLTTKRNFNFKHCYNLANAIFQCIAHNQLHSQHFTLSKHIPGLLACTTPEYILLKQLDLIQECPVQHVTKNSNSIGANSMMIHNFKDIGWFTKFKYFWLQQHFPFPQRPKLYSEHSQSFHSKHRREIENASNQIIYYLLFKSKAGTQKGKRKYTLQNCTAQ